MTNGSTVRLGARVDALTRVGRVGRPAPAAWFLTFGALLVMLVTTSVRTGAYVPDVSRLVAVVVLWLPLLLRTWRPLLALAGTVMAESAYLALYTDIHATATGADFGAFQPVPLATMVAAWTVASRARRLIGWSAGLVAGAVLFFVSMATHESGLLLPDLVMFNLVALATGIGAVVAARREAIEAAARAREEDTRQAVLDERLRIARELHDVLAHNLTLVNAQAAVADFLIRTDPDAASGALKDITRHTSRAIDELRATVGLLRHGDDGTADDRGAETGLRPVPGLNDLDRLIEEFRATGHRVDLAVTGEPAWLGQQGDLAAYRLLQEALTNAAKHGPDEPVTVRLQWSHESLSLWVSNRVPAMPDRTDRAPGTGHGIIGMAERAASAGGSLTAGPTPDGRFEVTATLPLPPAHASDSPTPATAVDTQEETPR
ncbi:sensor histidine kinase [Puerhibacterium puerhi]|uniref:sensor histidine kinase n=1 Tax=Puerhibacterium puerhi TaxID=2692623 RepID=UPI001F2895F0|nr:histidine kinase [Puerhibacterium puerhi]